MTLHLFSFFHLNLAFSSIEEELRPEVIRRCYWPLLQLADRLKVPIGIEASGYTLEVIRDLDPGWVEELKRLCALGHVSFIGSGYAQLIGPLVPAKVNAANQRIGMAIYESLLGFRPKLVLVSEQAFSAGLVRQYLDAGYQAMVMEWDNPGSYNPGWNPDWRYFPQYACGTDGERIPVIWNKSIPFQKFQRYAHGEMELEEYLAFLESRVQSEERFFALYGNDAEIFDFRPGRYRTEAGLSQRGEWDRVALLYEAIRANSKFKLVPPEYPLNFLDRKNAGHCLRLQSVQHPVPVKKQAKYNICRWAVTGRDDLGINTDCWRAYGFLQKIRQASDADWKELCYLWSSDFRTHITASRWKVFNSRLRLFVDRLEGAQSGALSRSSQSDLPLGLPCEKAGFAVKRDRNLLNVETPYLLLKLNCRRGLAIESFSSRQLGGKSMFGTLPHGYFDQISLAADFYSGHLTFEIPGRHQITDLVAVEPELLLRGDALCIRCSISTELGPIHKEIIVDPKVPEMTLRFELDWPEAPNGALRLGHITLNPEAFEHGALSLKTHNGGEEETFSLGDTPVNHMLPVSALVSSNQAFGVTEGFISLGDGTRQIQVETDKAEAAVIAQLRYEPMEDTYLCRIVFSAQEQDDTSCHATERQSFSDRKFSFRFSVQ